MPSYAQTNIQLLNQLQREGYSKEDIMIIANTYQLAMKIFTGSYRPSGKTFIAHVIGTASILASLHVSAKIVAAGLIHSIYAEGDFGSLRQGVSSTKREEVRSVLGEEIEEYVYRYASLKWDIQNILAIRDRVYKLDPIERDVILIRLADQLEDNLDSGILYCPNYKSRQKFFENMSGIIVEITNKIGFPTLATELKAAFQSTLVDSISRELCNPRQETNSFFIPPKSYHRKLSVVIFQQVTHILNYFRWISLRLQQKLCTLYSLKKVTD
jgi:(p)ppGpp synthase/HD superfamily hydrolase